MNSFAFIAIVGWIPIVFVLFLALPRRTALLAAFVVGWLFLPERVIIQFAGFPDFGKINVTSFAPLFAVLLLDASRVFRFRPGWRDLPIVLLCICPYFSSITNGLGSHDGLSSMLAYVSTWGVPWLLGRVYLNDADGLRRLARAIVVGGAIYVPLCLIEIRLSPQLHRLVYGAHQHQFAQTARGGGWRPDVFMQHGLMVAFWLAAAALLAATLTRARLLKSLFGVPAGWCTAALAITLVLCKSMGAIVLFVVGWLVTRLAMRRQASWIVVLLLILPPFYVAGRVSGAIDSASVRALLSPLPSERVESVAYRLKNEDPMIARALLQPAFGWGGWGRARVVDDEGVDITTADSLWIVYLGRNGLVGLVAVLATLLIGPVTFLQRVRAARWLRPEYAPAFTMMLVVVLFAIDCTMNAMVNPIYILGMGALVSLPRPAPSPATPAPAPAPPAESIMRA